MASIPRISLNDLNINNLNSINKLNEALELNGFFSLCEHNIDQILIDECYEKSKEFFNLDTYKKNKYANPHIAGARGYTPFGKETALGETTPDLKEFWHHGPLVDETYDLRIHKNIDVDEVKQFNITFDKLFNELNDLAVNVLSCIGFTIGLDKDYFYPWVDKGNSLLRMIHYPPADNTNIYRAREHADINLITLLIGLVILSLFYFLVLSEIIDNLIYSVIIGGALGNFYDRLVYNAVPDFIDLHYKNFHWFTFNVADIFITIGILIFMMKGFFIRE